jgi:signal peptidase I
MKTQYKRYIATILSILLPGAGQVYKGQTYKTVLGYSLFFLLPIVFFIFKLYYHFLGLLAFIALLSAFYAWNVADAFWARIGKKPAGEVFLNKWLIIFPAIFFSINAYAMINHLNPENTLLGVRALMIPTNSMNPTLQAGDFIITDLNYYHTKNINRKDIIVFRHRKFPWILKRVIALPGDTVKGEHNRIYVNGKLLNEPYALFIGRSKLLDNFNKEHSMNDFGPITVPAGTFFVMGDNRDNSFDSRDPRFGLVEKDDVRGKPLYIYWSNNKSRIGRKVK